VRAGIRLAEKARKFCSKKNHSKNEWFDLFLKIGLD
jgi:hypothetical protein